VRFVARAGGTIIRPTRKGEFMSRKLLLAGASAVAILVAANAAGAKSYTIPGMYTFTVPTTGEYAIDLVGASGGSNFAANPPGGLPGGLGAEVFGDVMLQAGEKLVLYVGGHGQDVGGSGHPAEGGAGGGGGSFIVGFGDAGGGGGAGLNQAGGAGLAGSGSGAGGGTGGGASVYGQGGGGGTFASGGNGGGGAAYNGRASGDDGISGSGAGSGAGGIFPHGGDGSTSGGVGGYAGGGGGGDSGGGGGSGYSGGGGGGDGGGGGGGGSYLASFFTNKQYFAGVSSPGGEITIYRLAGSPVPEPSTWAMTFAGFASLGWLARHRRRKPGAA
jgi:PEP-CTERM motif